MKIKIYGTGCAKCRQLAENVRTAADAVGSGIELEKVTDMNEIVAAGIMTTPALAINGKVVSSGKVLSPVEIAKMLPQGESSCGCGCNCKDVEPKKESSESSCCCGRGGGAAQKAKGALTALLLLFVIASLAVVIMRETKGSAAARELSETDAEESIPTANDILTVYYFHGMRRCTTCNKIERFAKEAIEKKYADELKSRRVVFKSVNVELPENEHFIKDFELASRTVVMAKGGKFEKFDDVWTLVREPEKFISYIQDGAAKMMGGGK